MNEPACWRLSLLARVATGDLRVSIDRVFPLSEAADAHRYIEGRHAFGRVLLRPDGVEAA